MESKPNWGKLKDDLYRLKSYAYLDSPAYSTVQRLTRACMSYLSSHFDDVDKCINSGLTSKDLMNRILRSRHDHTTLESVLRVIDVHLDSNYLAEIREKLVSKFEDDELLSLTLKSNKNTIDYIKQTIEVDVLINLLEGRAIFKDGKSIEQFSREIIEIFESVYPLKRNLLKAS